MHELRRRQAEFDDVTARMDEGLVLFSSSGDILFSNNVIHQLFPQDKAAGNYLTLCRDANYIQVVEQALDGKGAHGKLERNGRIYELTASSVEENSAWHAAVLLIVDITERERAEQQRQEFTANVSHELKTPMTSMKVLADSLVGQEGVPEELYQEFMRDITAEIDRENRIITDLLTLVKMDKKSADLQISHMDINQLLEDILKRLRPIADKRNIDLILDSFRPSGSGLLHKARSKAV